MSTSVSGEAGVSPAGPLDGVGAFVPGGYGGIGEAISEALATAGARVAIGGRSQEKADALAARLTGRGMVAAGCQLDVASRTSVTEAVGKVAALWGRIDILVNCASRLVVGGAATVAEADWWDVMDTNLGGAFWLSQAVGRVMMEVGQGGRIVHLSSVRAVRGAASPPTVPARRASNSWSGSSRRSGGSSASRSTPSRPASSRRKWSLRPPWTRSSCAG